MNDPHQQFIFNEIAQERERQDRQWGGPEHDDRHSVNEWVSFIASQLEKIGGDLQNTRGRFIKTAALAVAAVESYDRWQERIEEEKRQHLIEVALRRIVEEPYGCAFCNSGTLRSVKDHAPDCGFALAEIALGRAKSE